jgi:hypothetical protein
MFRKYLKPYIPCGQPPHSERGNLPSLEDMILSSLSIGELSKIVQQNKLWMYYPILSRHAITLIFERKIGALKELLALNPEALLEKIDFEDNYKRKFTKTSPLMYLAWLYDTELVKSVLECLEEQSLKYEALEQLEQLELDEGPHGSHYDFSVPINALQEYINNQNGQPTISSQGLNSRSYWKKIVEPALEALPLHVAIGSFYPNTVDMPLPDFKSDFSARIKNFYNYSLATFSAIFPPSSRRTIDYVNNGKPFLSLLLFGKRVPRDGEGFGGFPGNADVRVDLAYLRVRAEAASRNLELEKERLRNQLELNSNDCLMM